MEHDIVNTLQVAVVLGFCIFIGYGAFLILLDKEREWKRRYGSRWFVSRSDKVRLDAEYRRRFETKD